MQVVAGQRVGESPSGLYTVPTASAILNFAPQMGFKGSPAQIRPSRLGASKGPATTSLQGFPRIGEYFTVGEQNGVIETGCEETLLYCNHVVSGAVTLGRSVLELPSLNPLRVTDFS